MQNRWAQFCEQTLPLDFFSFQTRICFKEGRSFLKEPISNFLVYIGLSQFIITSDKALCQRTIGGFSTKMPHVYFNTKVSFPRPGWLLAQDKLGPFQPSGGCSKPLYFSWAQSLVISSLRFASCRGSVKVHRLLLIEHQGIGLRVPDGVFKRWHGWLSEIPCTI